MPPPVTSHHTARHLAWLPVTSRHRPPPHALAQDLFVAGDYPDPDIDWCRNLFVCWVSAVTNGLREGDIGKIMEPRPSSDSRYLWIVLYQVRKLPREIERGLPGDLPRELACEPPRARPARPRASCEARPPARMAPSQFSYYIIVITILLNVIFGIIIDTFGQLRTDAAAKRASMENVCFICGVDRFTFDTQGGGFRRHVTEDHNMWSYLYMIVHLREKEPTEYNGWEQYVADKMNARDTSFFPLNHAIVLKEHKEREERSSMELLHDVRDMHGQMQALGRQLERLERALGARVDGLASQQQTLEQALHTAFSAVEPRGGGSGGGGSGGSGGGGSGGSGSGGGGGGGGLTAQGRERVLGRLSLSLPSTPEQGGLLG